MNIVAIPFEFAQASQQAGSSAVTAALFTAGGTILGALITICLQAYNASHQRAHERRGRIFDARRETYAEFAHCVGKFRTHVLQEQAGAEEHLDKKERLIAAWYKAYEVLNIIAGPDVRTTAQAVVDSLFDGADVHVIDERIEVFRTEVQKELELT